MKKLFVLLLPPILLLLGATHSQPNHMLDRSFFSTGQFGIVRELKLSGDSVLIIPKKDSLFSVSQSFHLESTEKTGPYDVLFLAQLPSSGPNQMKAQKYQVWVLQRSHDQTSLKVLVDLRRFYTLEDAQRSFEGITSFEDAYFDTWYDQQTFKTQTKLPGIGTMGRETMQSIVDEWARKIHDGQQKLQNIRNDSLVYGPRPWQFTLSDLLIKHRFNPLVSIEAFNSRAVKLGIRFPEKPNLLQRRQTVLVVDSVQEKIKE